MSYIQFANDAQANSIENNIVNLRIVLQNALNMAQAIDDEFAANGTDSLANIDYGAELNTQINNAQAVMIALDSKGVFTSGWTSDDEFGYSSDESDRYETSNSFDR